MRTLWSSLFPLPLYFISTDNSSPVIKMVLSSLLTILEYVLSVCSALAWSFPNRLEHIRTLYHDDFRRLVSVGLVKAKAGSASIRSRPLSSSKNDLQCPKLCRAIYFVCALGLGALFCCFFFCPLDKPCNGRLRIWTKSWISFWFQLGDFPPILWTFDAHSLWHLGTAPFCYFWYRLV